MPRENAHGFCGFCDQGVLSSGFNSAVQPATARHGLRQAVVRNSRNEERRGRATPLRLHTGLHFHKRAKASMVALAFALAFAASTHAQTATRPETAKPAPALRPRDLSGLWFGGVGGGLTIKGKVAPMLPEAQKRFDSNTAELKSDRTISADPTFRCEPPGVPHIYGIGGYSIEIMQTSTRILLFYESVHTFRTIWMDGRKPPEDADPLWMGFSVGHWEGNDLVVDSTGFNDKTWINGAGYPHSEALHVIERFHRADLKHMQLDITIEDPKSYTQPWKMGVNFTLQPNWEFGESFCIPTNQSSFKSQIIEQNDKDKPIPKNGP